jgi:alkyl sulfatase BDS1-like metallo-beta-lactamase superfamily hydrolase
MNTRLLASGLLACVVTAAYAQQPQGPAMRSIVRVTGDLYRAQNNDHYTVFLVTPAGIILADPISTDFSTWLAGQLAERFPNRPVRYVLYSHHHQDRGARELRGGAESSGRTERGGREALCGGCSS